jgi:hypothetical protein
MSKMSCANFMRWGGPNIEWELNNPGDLQAAANQRASDTPAGQ